MTCGASKRKSGEPCRMVAMPNGRCRIHGGTSLAGIAAPTFKTGRYSKYLPSRLVSRYEAAASDPELLALRDDIGLLDTRIAQVVSSLDTGESADAWSSLLALWQQLDQDMSRLLDEGETPETMERTVAALGDTIRNGFSQGYVWNEIRGLLKERMELVASERKRLVEMQQYVTAEQAMNFVGAVMASVRRNVSDRSALAAIASDVAGFSRGSGGQYADAGGSDTVAAGRLV